MVIREANLADVEAIAKVHVDTWRTTYSKLISVDFLASLSYEQRAGKWVDILSNPQPDSFTFVAENDIGEIIGFASGGRERTGDRFYQGELYAIYILEQYQGQRLGHRLISSVADKLFESGINSMLVWVLAENSACRFYESLGGQRVDQKTVEIGNVQLLEVAYGWKETLKLRKTP